jgi:hypothetical protein
MGAADIKISPNSQMTTGTTMPAVYATTSPSQLTLLSRFNPTRWPSQQENVKHNDILQLWRAYTIDMAIIWAESMPF